VLVASLGMLFVSIALRIPRESERTAMRIECGWERYEEGAGVGVLWRD
jgi:hypothetical protein